MSQPEFPTIDEWCDVLGRPIDDPAVIQVRIRIGNCEEYDSSDRPGWRFNRQGVELNFRRQMGNIWSRSQCTAGSRVELLKHPGTISRWAEVSDG